MNSETLFSNMKATNSKSSLSLCDASVDAKCLTCAWFFNKWKQIEIIKIHAESHEHKQSFIKWIGFKNFLWQIEVLLTQVKSSVC